MSPLQGKVALIVGVANAHSIAAGCAQAMDISVHSLIRMARLAGSLLANGGTILTMTYSGGEKDVDNDTIMDRVGIAQIDAAHLRAPGHALVTIVDVGAVAVMLASGGASRISGDITYVDGGLHVRA